jgi:hypothetical protein
MTKVRTVDKKAQRAQVAARKKAAEADPLERFTKAPVRVRIGATVEKVTVLRAARIVMEQGAAEPHEWTKAELELVDAAHYARQAKVMRRLAAAGLLPGGRTTWPARPTSCRVSWPAAGS